MTEYQVPTYAQIHEIEMQARALRAQAMREMFASLRAALTGLFRTHRPA